MKKTNTILFLILFIQFIPLSIYAQMWDYEKTDVENLVWSDKEYNQDLPSEWNNKSAIIIDKQIIHEIKETSLTGVGHTAISHYKIKIQDQAALKKYSEFYFDSFEDKYIYIPQKGDIGYYDSQKSFYGFRIIKPDGKIEIIDTKKEIIQEREGRKLKNKIAIPYLQVGDILDYYVYRYAYARQGILKRYVSNFHFISDIALLQDNYPTLKLKYKIITDKNCKVQLLPLNGASVKEEKKGEEYSFIVNKEKLKALDYTFWDFPIRTRPVIKINVKWYSNFISNLEKEGSKYYSERKIDEEVVEYNVKDLYDADVSGEYKDFNKYLKKSNKSNISNEKKAEEFFYYLRHKFKNMHLMYDAYNTIGRERDISQFRFCQNYIYGLKKMDIDYDYLLAIPRSEGDISELLNTREAIPILKINFNTPQFVYFEEKFSRYNLLPKEIEGVNCMSIMKGRKGIEFGTYQLPSSKAENNLLHSNLNVDFTNENLNINGEIKVSGQRLSRYQNNFVSVFDFVIDENIRYRTKRWGDINQLKDGKMKDKLIQMKKDEETDFNKNIKDYLISYFELNDIDFKDAEKKKIALTPEENELMFEYNANIKEMINKVGNNYIVRFGKLTGKQIQLKEEDLKRDYDIYISYPRKESHHISFNIPENYEIKGVEKLNISTENSFGKFKSVANIKNGKLILDTELIVNTNYAKAENWNKLVQILNAAFELQQKDILLKKI